jgi:hypothetical protein
MRAPLCVNRFPLLPLLLAAILAAAVPASAQLNTQHIKGTVGLKGASQPPPHVYAIAPLLYFYSTDTVKDEEGDRLPIDASISSAAGAAGVSVVTTKKLFGANYGYQLLFPVVINNRLQGTEIDSNPGAGMSDSAVVPISLGWHGTRTDSMASYTVYMPTGRYAAGASDNAGFGMWGHELAGGATVYLNAKKSYHVATVASLTFQSKKEQSETKVGTALNLEGGIGGDFRHGKLTAGLVYYASMKVTEDEIDGFPQALVLGKNKVFALGPEVSFPLERKGTIYGFFKVNYQHEVYARVGTQGGELSIMATFLVPALKLPKH